MLKYWYSNSWLVFCSRINLGKTVFLNQFARLGRRISFACKLVWVLPFLALGFMPNLGQAAKSGINPKGTPKTLEWFAGVTAFEVPQDEGLKFSATGPTVILFEFRSKRIGKRVIIDILEGERFRSRNPVKLRAVGGGRHGFRFATLLTMSLGEGVHELTILVQGGDLVVIPTERKKLHREFLVRPFEDTKAPPPEEALAVAKDAEVGETKVETETSLDGAGKIEPATTPPLSSREADIFGSPDEMPTDKAIDDSTLAGSGPSTEETGVRLALTDDVLSIGGRMLSQAQYTGLSNQDWEAASFSNRTWLDAYFDARTTEDVRGFAQGRIVYSSRGKSTTDLSGDEPKVIEPLLDQLWLKFNVYRRVFITGGQQPLKWGSGRFWNPTDFINTQVFDPLALLDERTGRPLLKIHIPVESLGWNFYGIANFSQVDSFRDVGAAIRSELALADTETALTAAWGWDKPLQLGADLSASFLGFEFRFEAGVQHGLKSTFWQGSFELEPGVSRFPVGFQQPGAWLWQVVIGSESTLTFGRDDSLIVGAEYFFNSSGYDSVELYPWLLANNAFTPLHVGKRYAGFYAMLPNPGSWRDTTLSLMAISNLSDGSWLVRGGWQTVFLNTLTVRAYSSAHLGHRGELRLGFKIPPQPGIEALQSGIDLHAPTWELGVDALINI